MPVGGSNEFIAFRATLTNSLRLLQKRLSDIPGLKYSMPATYNVFPNTLYYDVFSQTTDEEVLEVLRAERGA